MSATWHFDDLEFLTLWGRTTGEWLPFPFVYTSDTSSYYDHLRQQRAATERVFANWDRSFDPALDTFTEPDLRISVDGMDRRDSGSRRIRMIGLRRGSRGYVVEQLAGEKPMETAGFTVSECDPVGLVDVLVAALPEATVGRQAQIRLVYEDESDDAESDPDYHRIIVDDIFGESARMRTKRFEDAPVDTEGRFEIVQGYSKFGPRGVARRTLSWRDLSDDGRYVIGNEPHVATPADAKRMVAALNVLVAAIVQKIREERAL
ncbi:ESX secretion-associated protein EspG [Nocardia sp. NPDC059240]|uniref:ESX secretion-associated protein EspG n=1 Tax=Nocardia sp. NPDC059240 TaxID=3346786 RepID=UPI0036BBA0EB